MLKESRQRHIGHLGTIFFNMSVVAMFAVAGIAFVPVLYMAIFLGLGVIVIYLTLFTVGTVWQSEGFKNFIVNSYKTLLDDGTTSLMSQLVSYIPMIVAISGGLIFCSLVTLFLDRKRKSSKNKLIIMIFFLVIYAALVIYMFVNNVYGFGK